MNVLKKINKLRIDRNWSIYRLSSESGIPISTITNMFNRETLPSISTLELLCNAFGISLSEFFEEDEIKKDNSELLSELCKKFEVLSPKEKSIVLDLVCELYNLRK